ncbi:DUF1671-domain-containing protein [Exidia glandulosa HHB12029]|uniref:DUF1671-domain-containing protein n=1 Tax=Exidia glandulosa HHB12029 TaxID=1314781 RepID=A0A165DQ41_EXIGL|nr:DUF1671-domain-containing protein [Exidia glandulosa HHB12029]
MPGALSSGRLSTYFQRKPGKEHTVGLDVEPPPRENIFWHPGLGDAPPPANFTPGVMPLLKRALVKTHAKGTTRQAYLCCDSATHVATERWDMGWGCGYRNFLMACTALMGQHERPEYAQLLEQPMPPGVRNLQRWIQTAWRDGYDAEGARQLKNRLVGTKRWIGTGELYTAFTHRGIPCRLVDFPNVAPQVILKWVRDYFDPQAEKSSIGNAVDAIKGASPVVITKKMPLVLQHAGHSRTIVGIEVNRAGDTNLLIYDPSRRPARQVREAALAAHLKIEVAHRGYQNKLSRVLHPFNRRKRERADEGASMPSAKKVRVDENGNAGAGAQQNLPETHTRAASLALAETQLDPLKLVKLFRLNSSKVGKNSKYQILWFPMTEPYTDDQRWAHREVRSEQIR